MGLIVGIGSAFVPALAPTLISSAGSIFSASGSFLTAVASATGVGASATATAGAVTATAAGAGGATAVAVAFPAVLVGACEKAGQITMDCWKTVLHDTSATASAGLLLSELLSDPRVVSHSVNTSGTLPEVTVTNKWNEHFNVYVVAYNDDIVIMHAEKH